MKDFIYQTNKNECGLACIKMLLAHLYKDSKFLYLPHKERLEGYNLFELREIAKQYGALLKGYVINNINHLPKKKEFILIKNLSEGKKHAILVKKMFSKYSYIYDPSEGKKLVSNKKLFNGIEEKMEVMCLESFSPVVNNFDVEPLVKNKDHNTLLILETLSVLCYFFCAYFVDTSMHFLYPVLFILAGVIFAIIFRSYNYVIMRKFDAEFIRYTYDKDIKLRRKNYKLMHETKSGILSSTSRLLLNLTSTLAVNVVLILNKFTAVFVLISCLIAILIDVAFITPKINNEMQEVEKIENELLNNPNLTNEEYETNYEEVKELSYKVAKRIDLKKITILFCLLMVTFFMSAMTNNANIIYILLYFSMCVFTYGGFSNCVTIYYKNKDNIINETKFQDLINNKKE